MLLRTASPNRTRGSCRRVALGAACILALAAVNASAQQGGGGGMCQGGGGGAGGGTGGGTGTTTATTGLTAALTAGSLRGGFGATSTGNNATASVLQSMQAHSNQFRQAQLNALAANAQLRADTQAMWAAARQRKQQALALRERTLAARVNNP